MTNSEFFKLSWTDLFHGLIVAIFGSILTGLIKLFQAGSSLNWTTISPVLIVGVSAGLAYLASQLVTNSQNQLFKTEKSPKVLAAKATAFKAGVPYGKVLILGLILSGLGFSSSAQSIWRPLDKTAFKANITVDKSLKVSQNASIWVWRISGNIVATELIYNKVTKQFDSAPLSAVGPGIGYKHMTLLSDGSIYNDFGVNFLALLGTDIEHITPASIKAALTVNVFNFLNIGADYSFGGKTFGILLGASVNF